MMMQIRLDNLSFKAIIGLLDFEREHPQRVDLTIVIDYHYSQKEFIDYAKVATLCQEHIVASRFELIEEALLSLQELLLKNFSSISRLNITLAKPDILPNATASLSLEWSS